MIGRILLGLAAVFALTDGAAAQPKPKPFVVILADPRGTEAMDLLVPYAILAESGAVEVKIAAPTREPVPLRPGKASVRPQATLAELARGRRPDVVIVPAVQHEDDEARAAWLREELRNGVQIMSICNGARVLAAAGVLDGRQAVVHWFSRGRMQKKHPDVTWRQDVRWITDGPVTTTAGITAGEPATLALLRRLAGEEVMKATAARLRLPPPDQRHRGDDYRLTPRGMGLVVGNLAAFWRRENVALPIAAGVDELALGAALDGWSRTYRSLAWATGPREVVSRHGLVILTDPKPPRRFARTVALPPRDADRSTFAAIAGAYGEPTARFVALQFEHPWGAVSAWDRPKA